MPLSDLQIAVLGFAAVLVFWMLGAYNRLVALRNAIGDAWRLVDDGLRKRGEAVPALVAALREPLAGEQGALETLLAAQAQVRSAADALRQRPVQAPLAAALLSAESAMASALARVLALLEQQDALRTSPEVAPQAAVIRDSAGRLAFSRQLFNDAAAVYNDALQQFPTRLLTPMFGFGEAGTL